MTSERVATVGRPFSPTEEVGVKYQRDGEREPTTYQWPAERYGAFAVAEARDNPHMTDALRAALPYWELIHAPTGMLVGDAADYAGPESLRVLAGRLLALPVDWAALTGRLSRGAKYRAAVAATMREWAAERMAGKWVDPGPDADWQYPPPAPFDAIVDYARRQGVTGIGALPGCWEVTVDAQWRFAVNGHAEPVACTWGTDVPPFSAYVEYHGWPAGVLDASGGEFAAGSGANAAAFLDALAKLEEGSER